MITYTSEHKIIYGYAHAHIGSQSTPARAQLSSLSSSSSWIDDTCPTCHWLIRLPTQHSHTFYSLMADGTDSTGETSTKGTDSAAGSSKEADKTVELSPAALEAIAEMVSKKLSSNPLKSPDTPTTVPSTDGKTSHEHTHTHTHTRT